MAGLYAFQRPFLKDATYSVVSGLVGTPVSSDPTPVEFTIDQGESASSIATRLERERLVRYSWGFRVMARLRGADGNLAAGVYSLRRNMSTSEVIDVLVEGAYAGAQATFPEGWRAAEMASLLEARKLLAGDEFLAMAKKDGFRYDFLAELPPGTSLEGYLFPDTYRVPPGTTPRQLLDQMLRDFDQQVTPEMRAQAEAKGLTLHEAITLASIVEREAQVAAERPLIAAVFLNRLEAGMPLQADATVQYAVAEEKSDSVLIDYWPKGLTEEDLATDSPYNTYVYKGLPPGPICNPGLAAIKAVLEAPETDYYYFVAKNDGSHVFAETLDEHNENVTKYQLGGQ